MNKEDIENRLEDLKKFHKMLLLQEAPSTKLKNNENQIMYYQKLLSKYSAQNHTVMPKRIDAPIEFDEIANDADLDEILQFCNEESKPISCIPPQPSCNTSSIPSFSQPHKHKSEKRNFTQFSHAELQHTSLPKELHSSISQYLKLPTSSSATTVAPPSQQPPTYHSLSSSTASVSYPSLYDNHSVSYPSLSELLPPSTNTSGFYPIQRQSSTPSFTSYAYPTLPTPSSIAENFVPVTKSTLHSPTSPVTKKSRTEKSLKSTIRTMPLESVHEPPASTVTSTAPGSTSKPAEEVSEEDQIMQDEIVKELEEEMEMKSDPAMPKPQIPVDMDEDKEENSSSSSSSASTAKSNYVWNPDSIGRAFHVLADLKLLGKRQAQKSQKKHPVPLESAPVSSSASTNLSNTEEEIDQILSDIEKQENYIKQNETERKLEALENTLEDIAVEDIRPEEERQDSSMDSIQEELADLEREIEQEQIEKQLEREKQALRDEYKIDESFVQMTGQFFMHSKYQQEFDQVLADLKHAMPLFKRYLESQPSQLSPDPKQLRLVSLFNNQSYNFDNDEMTREEESATGKVIQRYRSGTKVIINHTESGASTSFYSHPQRPVSSIRIAFPNGIVLVKYKNGDFKIIVPKQRIEQFNRTNCTYHITFQDQTKLFYYLGAHRAVKVLADGTRITVDANGCKLLTLPDNRREYEFKNGSRKVVHPNGITEMILQDGRRFVKTNQN